MVGLPDFDRSEGAPPYSGDEAAREERGYHRSNPVLSSLCWPPPEAGREHDARATTFRKDPDGATGDHRPGYGGEPDFAGRGALPSQVGPYYQARLQEGRP